MWCNGILLATKKNKITPFTATWMDLEILRKWSKSDRERQIPHYITYLWNLNYDTNELTCEADRLIDMENRCEWPKRKGSGGGMEWEFGVSRCKFMYRMDKYKVLLCSTGNYIQYPVINHNGKEYEKRMYMGVITEMLSCASEMNTAL